MSSRSARLRAMNASRSACHCTVSRVITNADSPAAAPKKPSSAGTKSPELIPCSYSSGSTSATFGLLRHHGGRITDRNRTRSPLAGSTRRSTRPRRRHRHRASTSRNRALAGVAVPPDQAMAALIYLACVRGDVGRNLFLERDGKHPPGTLTDQLVKVDDELGAALFPHYTQHRGVPSSPAVARRRPPACWSSRKVCRALIWKAHPQLQVIPPRIQISRQGISRYGRRPVNRRGPGLNQLLQGGSKPEPQLDHLQDTPSGALSGRAPCGSPDRSTACAAGLGMREGGGPLR